MKINGHLVLELSRTEVRIEIVYMLERGALDKNNVVSIAGRKP